MLPSILDLKAASNWSCPDARPACLRRFRKHRLAVIVQSAFRSCSFLLLSDRIVVLKLEPTILTFTTVLPAYAIHWFGSDSIAADVFNRVIYGWPNFLFIGVLAVVLRSHFGTVIGGMAAYFGAGGCNSDALYRACWHPLLVPAHRAGKISRSNAPTINIFGRTFSGSVGIVIVVIG